jgi:hypothetical protein
VLFFFFSHGTEERPEIGRKGLICGPSLVDAANAPFKRKQTINKSKFGFHSENFSPFANDSIIRFINSKIAPRSSVASETEFGAEDENDRGVIQPEEKKHQTGKGAIDRQSFTSEGDVPTKSPTRQLE